MSILKNKKYLSTNFTFQELTYTKYSQYLLLNQSYAKDYLNNLILLSNYILEPVRAYLNSPLIITSGFRYKALNDFCGGQKNSQHLLGCAVDFIPKNKSITKSFEILKNQKGFCFGQLILEKSWLHISLGMPFRSLENCFQSFKVL